jgi:DtxR family transcriptional regulator, manganese transport regulator
MIVNGCVNCPSIDRTIALIWYGRLENRRVNPEGQHHARASRRMQVSTDIYGVSSRMADFSDPRNQYARTRDDHATETAEDYAEAIAELLDSTGECRVTDLATRFAVSHVTVNRTVARLQRDGLITTEPYAPIQLTDDGRSLACEAKRRHTIVLQFLLALGVSEPVAITDAEGIEHHVSGETLHAMEQFMGAE